MFLVSNLTGISTNDKPIEFLASFISYLFDSSRSSSSDECGSSSSAGSSSTSTTLETPQASQDSREGPKEDEEYDDALESEEDDIGYGDVRRFESGEDQDSAQQIVIDVPQKDEAYKRSKAKMEKEKEEMIDNQHVINVRVKPKQVYNAGGRVQRSKGSQFEGQRGTIVEVVSEREQYKVEW